MEVKLNLFTTPALVFFILILLLLCGGLSGCASSSVERGAATQVDNVYENGNYALTHAGDSTPINAFQNANQTSKGILLGAGSGAAIVGFAGGAAGILPGAVGGAIVGSVLGAYVDYHTNIIDQLENRGVKVLILGDNVLIVMPSAWVFEGRTARIRVQADSTLDLVAALIRRYTTMSVKVAAYTNDVGDNNVNCYISQQQADNVVKYLWPRVNTRLLFASGNGGTHLIERNNLDWDKGANYRVEISFEKLPV